VMSAMGLPPSQGNTFSSNRRMMVSACFSVREDRCLACHSCHHLEAVRRPVFPGGLLGLAVLAGVDVVGEPLARINAALTGVLQGNIGVDAER